MRFIAHRVFRDGERLDRFDARRIRGFEGAEVDLRVDAAGELVVRHSPVFAAGRSARRLRGHRFADALALLGRAAEAPRLLLLDVKCVAAASAAAALVASRPVGAETVFNVWHPDEIAAIRAHLPGATILYCAAPIVAARAPGRLGDLVVCNSFPFFWRSANFAPDLEKANRHNINVKVISRRRVAAAEAPPALAPEGADGLTVHRLFWNRRLAGLAAAQGLKVAVYGLGSRAHALAEAAHGPIDYAIIGDRRAARREAEAQSPRRAA